MLVLLFTDLMKWKGTVGRGWRIHCVSLFVVESRGLRPLLVPLATRKLGGRGLEQPWSTFWALRCHFFWPGCADCPQTVCTALWQPFEMKTNKQISKWRQVSSRVSANVKLNRDVKWKDRKSTFESESCKQTCSMRSGLRSKWVDSDLQKEREVRGKWSLLTENSRTVPSSLRGEGHLGCRPASVGWGSQYCSQGALMLIVCVY